MRSGPCRAQHEGMESPRGRRFTLELAAEPEALPGGLEEPVRGRAREPIAGRLTDERGTTVPFTGWLGLGRALEKALKGFPGPALEREEGVR
jgi:hypothetical protein